MCKPTTHSPETMPDQHAAAPEIDYSPKRYTWRQQMTSGAKIFTIFGILLLLFWILEVYLA